MPFPNHRNKFVALLGGKCEECGEEREPCLRLAPRKVEERRKINILLRQKRVHLEELKEDFILTCFNCRAIWEAGNEEFRQIRRERVKENREQAFAEATGNVSYPDDEKEKLEDFKQSFNVKKKKAKLIATEVDKKRVQMARGILADIAKSSQRGMALGVLEEYGLDA